MRAEVSYRSNHAESTETRKVAGLTLSEAKYTPNLRVPKHSHRLACFGLALQGSYVESYGQKALECKPLSLKFRPAGELHSNRYGSPVVRCFFIELDAEWLEHARECGATLDKPRIFRRSSLLWLATRIRRESRSADALSPLVIEGKTLEMIAEAARDAGRAAGLRHPPWLKQVREFIHENFSETLTLSRIAEMVGVHPVYLASVFRRHYRCSVGEYVRRLRVEFACRQIRTTDARLADIALAAGFPDQAQLTRTFKSLTGSTPARYRSEIKS